MKGRPGLDVHHSTVTTLNFYDSAVRSIFPGALLLRGCQRTNDGARLLLTCVLAFLRRLLNCLLHSCQVGQFGVNLQQALIGNTASGIPFCTILQGKQLRRLFKRETLLLRPPHKAHGSPKATG